MTPLTFRSVPEYSHAYFRQLKVGSCFNYHSRLYMKTSLSIVFDFPNTMYFDDVKDEWMVDFVPADGLAENVEVELSVREVVK